MTTSENQVTRLDLKKAYKEICLGYSPFQVGNTTLYFKHLSVFDKIRCDEFYEEALATALRLGKKKEKELFDKAKETGEWSKMDERSLLSYKKDLNKMMEARSKSLYDDQVEEIEEVIEEYNLAIKELNKKKYEISKSSAENHAMNEYIVNFILESVYTDNSLKTQKWSDEDKSYQKVKDLNPFFEKHNRIFSRFSSENLKKIAICDYFQEGFSLVTDMSQFFNKKVFDLSDYQVQLLKYGSKYKEVLSEAYDAPDEYFNDPNKLEQWYILKKNRANNPDYKNSQDGEKGIRDLLSAEDN